MQENSDKIGQLVFPSKRTTIIRNKVVCFRGLPGVGKSYLCTKLMKEISERYGTDIKMIRLSRDVFRNEMFFPLKPTFSNQEKDLVDEWIFHSIKFFFSFFENKTVDNCKNLIIFIDGMCLSKLSVVFNIENTVKELNGCDFKCIECYCNESLVLDRIENEKFTHVAGDSRDYHSVKKEFQSIYDANLSTNNYKRIQTEKVEVGQLAEWTLK